MIASYLMCSVGWTDVWYAGGWYVGFWTGPDKDLICVRNSLTADDAEDALSPRGRTLLHAIGLSLVKLVRVSLRNRQWGRDILQVPHRGDGPGEVEQLHGDLDREKSAFWQLRRLYEDATLTVARARDCLKKATDNDGTVEELAELLVLDLAAEHERAVAAEERVPVGEHGKLSAACDEYLEAIRPGTTGYMPDILRNLTEEARRASAVPLVTLSDPPPSEPPVCGGMGR